MPNYTDWRSNELVRRDVTTARTHNLITGRRRRRRR